jgi:hypothetical protein
MRIVFVAPACPDPVVRTSPPVNSFVIKMEKGIDPIRYATRLIMAKLIMTISRR